MTATLARLQRLVRLDPRVFDEIRMDRAATPWAVAIVAISLLLLGLGGWLWFVFSGFGGRDEVFFKSVILGAAFGLALWLVWLLVVYVVLERLSGRRAPIEELVRAAGLASAPLALGLFMLIPAIAFGVGLLALAAWVLSTQIAIERVSDATSAHVLVANLAGFGVWAAGMSLLATADNTLAPGPFLAEAIWDAVSYSVG